VTVHVSYHFPHSRIKNRAFNEQNFTKPTNSRQHYMQLSCTVSSKSEDQCRMYVHKFIYTLISSTVLPAPISARLTTTHYNFVDIFCDEFDPSRSMNAESTGSNSIMLLRKVRLSLYRSAGNVHLLGRITRFNLNCSKVYKIVQNFTVI